MKQIGIRLADGSFYPILEDGSASEKKLVLTTVKDNQTRVLVDLYRSKTGTMEDAEYIDTLQIDNLVQHASGEVDIPLDIALDENNNLSAAINDPETGSESKATVTLVSRTLEERMEPTNCDVVDAQIQEDAEISEKDAEISENDGMTAAGAVAAVGAGIAAGAITASILNDKDNSEQSEPSMEDESVEVMVNEDQPVEDLMFGETSIDDDVMVGGDAFGSELDGVESDSAEISVDELAEDADTNKSVNFDDLENIGNDGSFETDSKDITFDESVSEELPDFSEFENDQTAANDIALDETVVEESDAEETVAEETASEGESFDLPEETTLDDPFVMPEESADPVAEETASEGESFDLPEETTLDDSFALPEESADPVAEESTSEEIESNDADEDKNSAIGAVAAAGAGVAAGGLLARAMQKNSEENETVIAEPEETVIAEPEETVVAESDETVVPEPDAAETVADNSDDFFSTDFSGTLESSSDADFSNTDLDLPDFEDEAPLPESADDFDDSFLDSLEEKSVSKGATPSSGINFDGLYDKETVEGNSDVEQDEIRKKTRVPVIICIICAIICIVATLLVLFVVPSKYNLLRKTSTSEENVVSQESSDVPLAEPVVQSKAEPEPVAAPAPIEAKEEEIVVAPEPEKVVPSTPVELPKKPADTTYKIKWGDTLWDIADAYYKNPWRYKKIARYNGIKNPDHIISGRTITIPAQ
ncbi:MAG: LysM peptidoglycan-binding domain-containing protein [Treponema sp.]|nr:LysM peptidoglycan-binding domain-containing protein [Treponema sp.]